MKASLWQITNSVQTYELTIRPTPATRIGNVPLHGVLIYRFRCSAFAPIRDYWHRILMQSQRTSRARGPVIGHHGSRLMRQDGNEKLKQKGASARAWEVHLWDSNSYILYEYWVHAQNPVCAAHGRFTRNQGFLVTPLTVLVRKVVTSSYFSLHARVHVQLYKYCIARSIKPISVHTQWSQFTDTSLSSQLPDPKLWGEPCEARCLRRQA